MQSAGSAGFTCRPRSKPLVVRETGASSQGPAEAQGSGEALPARSPLAARPMHPKLPAHGVPLEHAGQLHTGDRLRG